MFIVKIEFFPFKFSNYQLVMNILPGLLKILQLGTELVLHFGVGAPAPIRDISAK